MSFFYNCLRWNEGKISPVVIFGGGNVAKTNVKKYLSKGIMMETPQSSPFPTSSHITALQPKCPPPLVSQGCERKPYLVCWTMWCHGNWYTQRSPFSYQWRMTMPLNRSEGIEPDCQISARTVCMPPYTRHTAFDCSLPILQVRYRLSDLSQDTRSGIATPLASRLTAEGPIWYSCSKYSFQRSQTAI